MKKIQKAYRGFTNICLFVMPLIYYPFLAHSFVQGKELTFKILVLVGVLMISFLLLKFRKIKVVKFWRHPIFKILGVFLAILFIVTLISPNPIVSTYGSYSRGFGLFVMFFLGAWFLIHSFFADKKTVSRAVEFSFFSALIVAAYALLQKFGIDPFFQHFDADIFVGRSFSFVGNPSFLGQFLALEFILGLYLYFSSEGKRKLFTVLSLFIILGGVFASETRSAMMGLVVGCFILGIKFVPKSKIGLKKLLGGTALVGMVTVILGISFASGFIDESRFDLSEVALRSLSSRLEIWKTAGSLIADRPIGYGLETFYIYFPDKVDKDFFTLEESLVISADRIHNEFLEVTFAGGVIAGILYLMLLGVISQGLYQTKDALTVFLYVALLVNIVQNQLAFPDINIAMLIAFVLGAVVALETKKTYKLTMSKGWLRGQFALGILLVMLIGYGTVWKPLQSHISYTISKGFRSISYDIAVLSLKDAATYTPQYSELWYELLFIDASSLPRALFYLEQIDGWTGNVIAWNANYYSLIDPDLAHNYFEELRERNPNHPNWTRAYADSLYRNGQYEESLEMYRIYLELVPDFWKWKDNLEEHSEEEQKSYRIFFKNVPDFWTIVERVEELEMMAK